MTDHSETAWEQDEIESHLRSAMDALTPNVFDKIDLSTPQEIYVKPSRRVRTVSYTHLECKIPAA